MISSQHSAPEARTLSSYVSQGCQDSALDKKSICECGETTAPNSHVADPLPQNLDSSSEVFSTPQHIVAVVYPDESSLQLHHTASAPAGQQGRAAVTRISSGRLVSPGSTGKSPNWPTPQHGSAADASAAFGCTNSGRLGTSNSLSPRHIPLHASRNMQTAAKQEENEPAAWVGQLPEGVLHCKECVHGEPGSHTRSGVWAGRGTSLKERLTDARQALARKNSGS